MAHRHTRQGGFTLIELLVVISIIVVLLAILLPVINAVMEKGRQTKCLANLHDIALATKLFYEDNKRYPDPRDLGARSFIGGVVKLYPDHLESAKALICPRDKILSNRFPAGQYSSYDWYDVNQDGQLDQSDAITYNYQGLMEAPDPNHTGAGTPGVADDPEGLPYGWLDFNTNPWQNNPLVPVWSNPQGKYKYVQAKWPALANRSAPGNTIICVCRHHEGRRVELVVRLDGSAKAVKIGDIDFIGQSEL